MQLARVFSFQWVEIQNINGAREWVAEIDEKERQEANRPT